MVEIIAHRINKISELKSLPTDFGVEIDLRDHDGNIVLEHDPFHYEESDSFEEYVKCYRHKTIILNIKSERTEFKVLEILNRYGITNYFFLDSSFPMIMNLVKFGEKNIALRFSEVEGLDTIRKMSGMVKWVWVDCFTKLPINYDIWLELKKLGYKVCLVSPDLLGRDEDMEIYKQYITREKIEFDAICVKYKNSFCWKNE